MSLPSCYYHSSHTIQTFCLHPHCILPLCQACQEIHHRDNPAGDHRSLAVSYPQAKQIAIEAIVKEQQSITHAQKHFHTQFGEFRTQLLSIIEKSLSLLENQLASDSYQFESRKSTLQERHKSIQEGSLKELIYHFENGCISPKSADYIFKIQQEIVDQFINKCCLPKYDKSTAITEAFDSETVTIHSPQYQMEKSPNFFESSQSQQSRSCKTFKSKSKRKGIFVASSPQAKHCSSIKNFTKRQTNQDEFSSVYSSRALTDKFKNSTTPTFPVKSTQKKLIRPHSQKKIEAKKYDDIGSSQFLGKVPLTSQQNWKKVVNTKDTNRSTQSLLRIKTVQQIQQQIMNPKQMRELIMKKRARGSQIEMGRPHVIRIV